MFIADPLDAFYGTLADTADLVVVGAYYGKGANGGMRTVFLMGTWDRHSRTWKTVCKVRICTSLLLLLLLLLPLLLLHFSTCVLADYSVPFHRILPSSTTAFLINPRLCRCIVPCSLYLMLCISCCTVPRCAVPSMSRYALSDWLLCCGRRRATDWTRRSWRSCRNGTWLRYRKTPPGKEWMWLIVGCARLLFLLFCTLFRL